MIKKTILGIFTAYSLMRLYLLMQMGLGGILKLPVETVLLTAESCLGVLTICLFTFVSDEKAGKIKLIAVIQAIVACANMAIILAAKPGALSLGEIAAMGSLFDILMCIGVFAVKLTDDERQMYNGPYTRAVYKIRAKRK